MAKGLIEIDPCEDAANGKEEARHRNLRDGLCGCWWNCLVFQADFCSGNAMGNSWVDSTQIEQEKEGPMTNRYFLNGNHRYCRMKRLMKKGTSIYLKWQSKIESNQ